MKVKKIIANTMPEAMQKIRKELGSDAVILNSRKIKTGGFLGMFKKTNIEVVAAIDNEPFLKKQSQSVINKELINNEPNLPVDFENSVSEVENHSVIKELQDLKELVIAQTANTHANKYDYPLSKIYNQLRNQEVTEDLATDILDHLAAKYDDAYPSYEQLITEARARMEEQLTHIKNSELMQSKKVVHFVGPTGVGKTTTLAKIAAKYLLTHNKKVAFITTDTYRIAAVDQLRTYAKILNVPMEVAYSKGDYDEALEKFRNYDLILVDTAGRNYRDQKYIDDLTDMIEFNEQSAVYLVLSITAKSEDLLDISMKFTTIPIEALILTKVDETTRFGSLYNLPKTLKKGILYLANGQDVPDDLIETSSKQIVEMILGDNNNE